MSKIWQALIVLSVTLHLVGFGAIMVLSGALLDAQWENLELFHRLSVDQQALRRELNTATKRFEGGARQGIEPTLGTELGGLNEP